MRERILNDLITAMKNKDKEALAVIRLVKGAMQLEEINKKSELNDEEVISILAKQVKTRKESIVEFEKAGREDLIENLKNEIKILETYLPEQLSEEAIETIVSEVFEQVKPAAKSDMGKVMGSLIPKVKGKADMAIVNKIVKEKFDKLS